MNIVSMSDFEISPPPDWESAGRVLCIPGSTVSGYVGWATLALTPEALVLATPMGIEETVILWGIEDVSVIKFEGVIIQCATSVGPIYAPLPYPHGIEVIYSLETRIRLRLRLVTLAANAAYTWAVNIRRLSRDVQLAVLAKVQLQQKSQDNK
jgi:hypothetical protein